MFQYQFVKEKEENEHGIGYDDINTEEDIDSESEESLCKKRKK